MVVVVSPVAPLDSGRIAAIAEFLDDEPSGLGDPIGERRRWDELAALPDFQAVVTKALAHAGEAIPLLTEEIFLHYSRTGTQTAYRDFEQCARPGFANLVLAECIDNRGRFLDRIHVAAEAMLSERTWVHSFHDPKLDNWQGRKMEIDLRVATISWSLSVTCHLLGDRLAPETRRRVRDELERRTFAPFREMLAGGRVNLNQEKAFSWLELMHNWNATCVGGVVCSALILIEAKEERARFVAAAERYTRNFIAGFPADGSCSEGVGYWAGGFTHFVMLAEQIHRVTHGAVDLLADAHVERVAQYGARLEIMPGVFPAFADCAPDPVPPADLMGFVSRRYGLGLRPWEDAAPRPTSLPALVVYAFANSATAAAEVGGTATPAVRELRGWFADAGSYVGRPGSSGTGALGVAFKGGHNGEFHNHNDLGSFVVAVNGKVLIIDPGSEEYTSRTFSSRRYESNLLNSYGHSVPVPAGVLQSEGTAARAPVLHYSFGDVNDVVTLDLAPAYEMVDLSRLERTFSFSRAGSGRLTVRDEVDFCHPQTFGTALVTTAQWSLVDARRIAIRDGEEGLTVHIEAEGGAIEIDSKNIGEQARTDRPPVRIGIDFTTPVERAAFEITIAPAQ